MKTLILLTASSLALGLAGCAPGGKPAVRAALDCPEHQGELTRTAMAADGKACTYRTGDGNVVTLQLLATNGDPVGALKALETSLVAPTPEGEKQAAERAAAEKAAAAEPAKAADAAASKDAERIAKEAAADAKASAEKRAEGPDADRRVDASGDDNVNVNLPGLHVEAHDGGGSNDHAHIDLPGIHINADGDSEQADIRVGSVSINAHDDTATIRSFRDVRLRGEAFSRAKRGLRATFIYTGKNLPNGYRFVGYEAGGPKAGPLAVAVMRSNLEGDSHDRAYDDVKRLVRKNGGV